MERSDGLLRSTRTHYILLLDKGVNKNLSWKPVLEIFANVHGDDLLPLQDNSETSLHKLLLDKENMNSLKVMILRARENARGMQDLVTKEVWEHVNQMYHTINSLNEKLQLETLPTIDSLSNQCILYNGVADTTMPRGLGWSFMNLGRYIERCLLTIEMANKYFATIDYNLDEEKDILQWRPLLLSLSGYELHLKTYRNTNYNHNTLHQVLFNENFTRSVLYTLKRIERYFKDVLKNNHSEETEALEKQLGRLLSKIKYTDFNSLNQTTLQPFLNETRKDLVEFSRQLAQHFFSYS